MEDQHGGGGGGGFSAGASFIWIVSCSLFLSIMVGGGCLLMYIIIPHEPGTMSWLAITGVALVCLPWMFWFFTFIYRVITRMSRNNSNSDGGKNNTNAANTSTPTESKTYSAE